MPEIFHDLEQGSEEWFAVRAGLPTASEFKTVQASGKSGSESITRAKYMRQLAGEILTGEPAPAGYSNDHMLRGQEQEDDARRLFSLITDYEPIRVGFVREGRAGCSPDSLIGEDAGLEIKCAIPAVQIERLQLGRLPPEHVAQVQGSLWVTGRQQWHFVSYCPRLPPLIVRVERDEPYIASLASAVAAFNGEVDNIVQSIRTYQDFKGQAAA
jgi:hypothetical protein